MELSQSAIANLYLWSLLVGGLLGLTYDCLRLSRLLPGGVEPSPLRCKRLPLLGILPPIKRRRLLALPIFLEDLFFGVFAGIAIVLLLYETFDGKIRLSALGLTALGFGVAHAVFGRFSRRVAALLGFLLEVAVRYLVWFGGLPLRGLVTLGRTCRNAELRAARKRYTKRQFRVLRREESQSGRKERGRNGKNGKKTVQPEFDGQDLSCGSGDRVDRGVHQQRHAL